MAARQRADLRVSTAEPRADHSTARRSRASSALRLCKADVVAEQAAMLADAEPAGWLRNRYTRTGGMGIPRASSAPRRRPDTTCFWIAFRRSGAAWADA